MVNKIYKTTCPEKVGYYTIAKFATELQKTPKTIRRWIAQKRVIAEKIGKCFYIHDATFFRCVSSKQKRQIEKDLCLMGMARKELWILGINALGPLHQGREILIDQLEKGIKIQILLLDPSCPEFNKRVENEEYKEKNNDKIYYGKRLAHEYNTSIALCRDIKNSVVSSSNFKVRVHNKEPTEALIIKDPSTLEKTTGICNYNSYPQNAKGKRGLEGRHIIITEKNKPEDFEKWVIRFEKLWVNAKDVDIHPFPVLNEFQSQ